MRKSVYTPTKEMLADTKFTRFLDTFVEMRDALAQAPPIDYSMPEVN